VKVYRRDEQRHWCATPDVYRDGGTFELPMLASGISVAELYDGVLDASGRSLLRSR
jgi:hypothetical protein